MDAAIRYIRHVLFAGYTQGEIGAATNYSQTAVAKAFRRGPSVEFLLRCALATGTPPDKLFDLAGKQDLAQRFRSAYAAEGEGEEEQLRARVRLLLDCGLGRQVEAKVKEIEERLMRFQAALAKAAESAGAEAAFAAAGGQVAALWRVPHEEASRIEADLEGGWRKYAEGPHAVYLKKPKRPGDPQASLLLEILREFA